MAIIACGIAAGIYAFNRGQRLVSSDDASIDADIVHIAASEGGRIIELPVQENAFVTKGDLLFSLDPIPYRYAVDQAEADLAVAQGLLASRQRSIEVETSNAAIAREQIARAQANYDLATRTVERLRPLAAHSYIPVQQLDQAQVAQRDAATSLAQARRQEAAALQAIGTLATEQATVRAREAALAIARRALDQTVVRAPHDGRITGLTVAGAGRGCGSAAVAAGGTRSDNGPAAVRDPASAGSLGGSRVALGGIVVAAGGGGAIWRITSSDFGGLGDFSAGLAPRTWSDGAEAGCGTTVGMGTTSTGAGGLCSVVRGTLAGTGDDTVAGCSFPSVDGSGTSRGPGGPLVGGFVGAGTGLRSPTSEPPDSGAAASAGKRTDFLTAPTKGTTTKSANSSTVSGSALPTVGWGTAADGAGGPIASR